jgi:hypothetical protein
MQRDNTDWWAYQCKCLTFGCLATTGVSNLRFSNNDGIRPNTSHYIGLHGLLRGYLYYLYVDMFVPHRKHTYRPPRPITEIALLLYVDNVCTSQETCIYIYIYICIGLHGLLRGYLYYLDVDMFVPHRKHIYRPPRPVTGIAFLPAEIQSGGLQNTSRNSNSLSQLAPFLKEQHNRYRRRFIALLRAAMGHSNCISGTEALRACLPLTRLAEWLHFMVRVTFHSP